MIFNKVGFHLFKDYDLNAVLEESTEKIKKEIENDVKSNLPKNNDDYVKNQIKKHKILPIEFQFDKISVSVEEQMIPANLFPFNYAVDSGNSYPKEVLSFHLPFSGDADLLKCRPSSRIMWTEEILVDNGEIIFDVIKFNDSADEIKKTKESFVNNLKQQAGSVNNQIIQFNDNLEKKLAEIIKSSEKKVDESSKFLEDLGVALKKDNQNE